MTERERIIVAHLVKYMAEADCERCMGMGSTIGMLIDTAGRKIGITPSSADCEDIEQKVKAMN